jgi:glycerol-3-phosphate acyltransferase PlsY
MLNLIVILLLAYLVGSIPTSIIITKLIKQVDIREYGSGNAGGTNVSRVLGKRFGILVVILDALKGAFAVIVVSRLFLGNFPFTNATPFDDFTIIQILAGIAAVVGHIWTVFAGFKGGKGIATGLGVLLTVVTLDMLLGIGIFVIVVSLSRYVSLGSILAALSIPVIMVVRENIFNVDIHSYGTLLPFVTLLVLLVTYTHKANIIRILKGNESKISFKKKA